jgi:anti-sigma regulatory factor (Ser/Thr protein kinase)
LRVGAFGYKPSIEPLPTTSERIRATAGTFAPKAARSYVRDVVRARDLSDRQLGDLDLLVSEIVTNAVRHAGTDIEVAVHCRSDTIAVEVRDFGPGVPEPRAAPAGAVGGWGLQLLRSIAARWGVVDADPGKVVWFELATG